MRGAIGILSVVLGCSAGAVGPAAPSSGPSGMNAAPPSALPPPRSAFATACQASCERAHMAQAVGWEMIQASCERSCAEDEKLPELSNPKQLEQHAGQRVRLRGILSANLPAGEKPTLRLGDQPMSLSGPAIAPELLEGLDGKAVSVAGVVRDKNQVESVSTVALSP